MPRRNVLTHRQRTALFDLPTGEPALLQHYTLADDDIEHIRTRRRPENQIGFALQLCVLRYPGRLLKPGEVIPEAVSRFIAAQLGLKVENLLCYAARKKTRREHLVQRDNQDEKCASIRMRILGRDVCDGGGLFVRDQGFCCF